MNPISGEVKIEINDNMLTAFIVRSFILPLVSAMVMYIRNTMYGVRSWGMAANKIKSVQPMQWSAFITTYTA
jgi:hypothetical protein